MAGSEDGTYYIELSPNPIRFDPVSKLTNVFFDDANKQVFAVRSGGATGVVVKGPDEKSTITFRMEDRGELSSIKFSYDMKILAIQRSPKSVEFINFAEDSTPDLREYSQTCKGKSTSIIGFNWTNINEIVFITNQGLEFYQVYPEKKSLKCLKTFGTSVNWFDWLPQSAVLLLSTGSLGNVLQPFHFRPGTVLKLPKFEVDLPVVPKPAKLCLLERDVSMANIMAGSEDGTYYIELSPNPIRFDPVSKLTNVFFDDANKQVFAVRSGGATGVVVKGPDEKSTITFRMEDRGELSSIKFSYDMKILAIQRSPKSVEFINFAEDSTPDLREYSQTCKGKSTSIIGFNWTNINEIVFITNQGLEFYQVYPEKKSLKCLKTFGTSVNWFDWLPQSAVLLLSTGSLGNVLQPFHFRPGTVLKLPKFEVDLPVVPKPAKLCLLERDVSMANIYGHLYIIVLRHQPKGGSTGAEIVLYQLQKESPARKTDILRLGMSGRFATNVVDNLVVVHHQASKTSMVFDIKLEGENDGYITHHHPVLSPLPIKPCKLLLPGLNIPSGPEKTEYTCELYSPNWIVFQPNIVIDAKLGCLWYVQLKLNPLVIMIPDKCKLMEFLLLRQDSKSVILSVCRQMLVPGQQGSLTNISQIYDMLNRVYKDCLESEMMMLANEAPNARPDSYRRNQVIIDQSDMYTHVFSVFEDNKGIQYKFMVAVLIEYIRSLNHFVIPVQHYLYELIINTLVHHNCFYQLHQFLQYHVLSDSKPLACLMLSLESVYPPAHQLALDMLKRLSTANEEIIEVLLSKQQLLPALRFIRMIGAMDTVSSRKFLDAAMATEDNMLFYTVFKFFEQRNYRLRGNPRFPSGEHCDQYIKHFESIFGTDALSPVLTPS
ncbi:regulator of MON1-CCZ1 complex-like [Liolophura sinensis]|uniref:regulator of MON1-CCZ1 complex-like n=1 Tax=Liolophura sinensis TaxID=3198878 RepID=UPI003158538D